MDTKNIFLQDCNLFNSSRNVGFHSHNGRELIYILKGSCRVETGKKSFDCCPGTFLSLPGNTPHNQINNGLVIDYFCVFRDNSADTEEISMEYTGKDEILESLFLHLSNINHSGDTFTAPYLIAAILCRKNYLSTQASPPLPYPEQLAAVMKYLRANYNDPALNLSSIAAAHHISTSALKQLFSRWLAKAPITVLRDIRMRKAEQLLLSPYLQVQEVAALCGFNDPDYFARVFKKYKGCTPCEYKDKH